MEDSDAFSLSSIFHPLSSFFIRIDGRVHYLRRPSFPMICWYRVRSSRVRYLSRLLRFPTILSSPRRDEWSFLCVLRCSVSSVMRWVSSAICTSGEPVSLSWVRYSETICCFASTLMDIESNSSTPGDQRCSHARGANDRSLKVVLTCTCAPAKVGKDRGDVRLLQGNGSAMERDPRAALRYARGVAQRSPGIPLSPSANQSQFPTSSA